MGDDAAIVTDFEQQNGDDVAMASTPRRQNAAPEMQNDIDFNYSAFEEVLEEEISQVHIDTAQN
ncbi:hypothetical protein A2U01_0080508, partial [Trifolium medium]|nr:hypothetical protein [Trifolium medium]